MPLIFFFIESLIHKRKQKSESLKIISSPVSISPAGLEHATHTQKRERGETVKVLKNDI